MSNVVYTRPWPDEPGGGLQLRQDPSVVHPCVLLRVCGELDPATAPVLEHTLMVLLEDGYLHLDLDLADVAFCDSSGLKVMIDTQRLLQQSDGTLVLHDLCRSLQILLGIFDHDTALFRRTPGHLDASSTRRRSACTTS